MRKNLVAFLEFDPCKPDQDSKEKWRAQPRAYSKKDRDSMKILKEWNFDVFTEEIDDNNQKVTRDNLTMSSKEDFDSALKKVIKCYEDKTKDYELLFVIISGYGNEKNNLMYTRAKDPVPVAHVIKKHPDIRNLPHRVKVFIVQGCCPAAFDSRREVTDDDLEADVETLPAESNIAIYWSHIPPVGRKDLIKDGGSVMLDEMAKLLGEEGRKEISLNELIVEVNSRVEDQYDDEKFGSHTPSFDGTLLEAGSIRKVDNKPKGGKQ